MCWASLVRSVAEMHELISAMEAKDVDRIVACFAADGELRSPVSRGVVFRGHDELRHVLACVYAAIGAVQVTEVVGEGSRFALVHHSEVGGHRLEELMLVRLDADGRVAELRLFVRGMVELVGFAAAIAPPIARRRGRGRALAVRALFTPLAALVRAGEPAGLALTGAGTRVEPG